jgi:hypothetical protein
MVLRSGNRVLGEVAEEKGGGLGVVSAETGGDVGGVGVGAEEK